MNSATSEPKVVYVQLMGEGTTVFRPTTAETLGRWVARLLPTVDYNPDDEDWEFKPGAVVRVREHVFADGECGLLAVSLARLAEDEKAGGFSC